MSKENISCRNPRCSDYNKVGEKNIENAGSYKTLSGGTVRRWLCRTCHHYFSSSKDRLWYRLRNRPGELYKIVHIYLQEEGSISSAAKGVGIDTRTASRWLSRLTQETEEAATFLQKECNLTMTQIENLRNKYHTRPQGK